MKDIKIIFKPLFYEHNKFPLIVLVISIVLILLITIYLVRKELK